MISRDSYHISLAASPFAIKQFVLQIGRALAHAQVKYVDQSKYKRREEGKQNCRLNWRQRVGLTMISVDASAQEEKRALKCKT